MDKIRKPTIEELPGEIIEAFLEAEYFIKAANYIIQKNEELESQTLGLFNGITSVYQVNHSFAVEMYMKCLHLITKRDYRGGHKLGDLYDFLDISVQLKLNEKYQNDYSESDYRFTDTTIYSFGEILHQMSDYFIYARYAFEKQRNKKDAKLYKLSFSYKVIRDTILEIYPQLNNHIVI